MNRNVDVLKYLLSVMIILLHCGFSLEFPILRVAVPVFFVASAYFFFDKQGGYRRFLRRALLLYGFWTIALLPYMVAVKYAGGTLGRYLAEFPLNAVLRSVFPASWYLAAYIVCISLVYWGRRRVWALLVVGVASYAFCCLETNYGALVDNFLPDSTDYFGEYLRTLYLSFPAGLVFVVAGCLVARYRPGLGVSMAAALIGGAGLAVESAYVSVAGLRVADDCYFSLMVLAPAMFAVVLRLPQVVGVDTLWLRHAGTIQYCSHLVFIRIFSTIFPQAEPFEIFLLTLAGATLLSAALQRLGRRYRLLRLSY